ncbi:hypothetical protein CMI37_02860 [Candidatus Pacearchaeota archaeon]|nr:hypothetical protein [Candidatus Pacearchaeota archaeon]
MEEETERLPCPDCGLPVPFKKDANPRLDERLCNTCHGAKRNKNKQPQQHKHVLPEGWIVTKGDN